MEHIKQIIKFTLNSVPFLNKYLLWKGKSGSNQIALTFDDGPIAENTERLLSILEETNTPATFFLLGRQIQKYPEIVKQILNKGHVVANHTYSHKQFDELSNHEALNEIEKGFTEIEKVSNIVLHKYFRAPKGDIRWRLLPFLFKQGIKLVFWTIDPKDYLLKEANKILNLLISYEFKGGEIILLHEYNLGTIEMIGEFIPHMKSRGFKFVTIPEMY